MNKANFDIIIPAFNEEAYIYDLLESLINVGVNACQIIVVDSGSTDKTVEIIKSFGNVFVEEAGRKLIPSKARNTGVACANSDVFVFLDADVIVTPEWKSALDKFIASEDISRLLGDTYQLSKNPNWLENSWFGDLRATKKKYINGGNLIVTRGIFEKLGGFSEHLETGEDVDFSLRASKMGFSISIDSAFYVHHEGNPKTIKRFIMRERWHGKGDLISFELFFKSKVALVSSVFILLHVVFLIALLTLNIPSAIFSLSAIVMLCALLSVVKFKKVGRNIMTNSFLFYFYFVGRSLSLYDRLIKCKNA